MNEKKNYEVLTKEDKERRSPINVVNFLIGYLQIVSKKTVLEVKI